MSARIDPNEEFREFVRYVQELALRAYPNPQRIGCPSPHVIHDVAIQPLPADHPAFQAHIVHCSPCIAAVIAERTRIHRRNATLLKVSIAAGLAVLVGATLTSYLVVHQARRADQSRMARNSVYSGSENQRRGGNSRSASSTQPSVSLLLRPGTPRSVNKIDGDYELTISPTVSAASLRLLLRNDTYPQYEVVIQTPDGQGVWRLGGLRPTRIPNNILSINVLVPAHVLHNDSYAIRLFGRLDGAQQLVDVYSFHVTK